MPAFRVFLSAVSSEFASARDALANDLQAHDVTVRVQRSFRHDPEAGTLLHKLRNYIERCDVVVCLIGARGGAGFPANPEAAAFRDDLPAGIAEASYTQWEFFFARRFNRRCLIYVATDGFRSDQSTAAPEDRPDLQAAFLAHVKSLGSQWTPVGSLHEFRAAALKDLLQAPLPPSLSERIADRLAAPQLILLPYPSLGRLFKGRDAFLRRLRASLTRPDGGTAAIAGRAVHGLGGVGKTRAAVEYAWAHRADYTALALLDAETPDKLQSGLAALVGPLRLPEAAMPEEAARMEAALAWVNTNPGWFLILDNIDTESALDAANRLLGRLQGGHVVLTSRLARFPRGMERLDLDVLTLDDAAAFLLEATATGRRKTPDDAVLARTLAEVLGQLALALEMAAATIEARGMGFAAYHALWQGNRARVIGWADQKITGYHHAVAETWRTSVDQLTEAGRHLLERVAFLAPDPVPPFLLEVPVPGVEGEDAASALDDLVAYSVATRDVDSGTFVVHRLVQDVTRRGLEAADKTMPRLTEALGWVDAAFAGDAQDVRTWAILNPLVPHAETVADHADGSGIVEPTVDVIGRLATLLRAKASHGRAEPRYRRALAIAESNFPPADPRIAARLNNLAQLLQDTNRLGEAEPLMRRALAIDTASFGDEHPNVAIDLNNLAQLLQDTNRLDEAEPLMRRVLAIDMASFGDDHPEVATDLNNLARLLRASNRHGEAEPLIRRSLAIDAASLGDDHPNVAIRLNNLAALLQATNRLDEAEPLMRRALAIDSTSFGDDHPNVAIDLNNLARLLQATDRLGEAEPLMRRALAIDTASFGDDHPKVARDLNNLARLLQDTNRLGEAEPLMRRALVIFCALEAAIGRSHPSRETVQGNYAGLLAEMGKSETEIRSAIETVRREAGLNAG